MQNKSRGATTLRLLFCLPAFINHSMIKGSKGIIDACLHAIRWIP